MRKGWLRSLVATAAVGASSLAFGASPAKAQCETSTFIEIPAGVTTFYYDDRSELPPVPGYIVGPSGTWVYEEGNGVPSLQRGGTHWTTGVTGVELPGETEICVETGSPDKIWF